MKGLAVAAASLLAFAHGQAATSNSAAPLRITHGIASGDVSSTSVVIWARASRGARMIVEYSPVTPVSWPPLRQDGPTVDAGTDFTGKVVLERLAPDTRYIYWVRFVATDADVVSETGQFSTTPGDDATRPLTLVWWGDIGGQSYCRDPERGYALFDHMARLAPDLAIASGDSVYVDETCPPVTGLSDQPRNALSADPEIAAYQLVAATDPKLKTPAEVTSAFRAKWKYNLEDGAYRRFRAQTPHLYQWDDHEVMNDWSPQEEDVGLVRGAMDPRPMSTLAAAGRASFFEYTPTRPHPQAQIYRSVRFGKLAEIFLLDDRSYRDANTVPDGGDKTLDVRFKNGERRQLRGKAKTLLGVAQHEWLIRSLREAEARGVLWKIIATDDPLSSVSGSYQVYSPEGPMTPLYTIRDGWASGVRLTSDQDDNQGNPLGAESELHQILSAIKSSGVKNVLWITADVHFSRLVRYEPAGDLQGLVFHEFISGPVSARSAPVTPISRTFAPRELYARGRSTDPLSPSFLNFGVLRIAADGALVVEIRDAAGSIPTDARNRAGTLKLTPQR